MQLLFKERKVALFFIQHFTILKRSLLTVIQHQDFLQLLAFFLGKTQILPNAGVGLHYQTREVYDCIQKGKIQSDVVPWSHTLSWSKTFEKLNKTRI